MANLAEISTFDAGVYQIEQTDDVIGGSAGIANLQGKALANRTLWLKNNKMGNGDGSASAPDACFSAEPSTGFYRPSSGVIGISTSGVERARISGSLLLWGTTVGAGASAGEVVVANNRYFRVVNGAGTATKRVIGVTSLDQVSLDPDGLGVVFGGKFAAKSWSYAPASLVVGAVATTIHTVAGSEYQSKVVVSGVRTDGVAIFSDELLVQTNVPFLQVLRSTDLFGSVAVRTYSLSGDNVRVAVSTSSYYVRALAIELSANPV